MIGQIYFSLVFRGKPALCGYQLVIGGVLHPQGIRERKNDMSEFRGNTSSEAAAAAAQGGSGEIEY